ncbi:bacteriochlorophyll 4-vinyl reductase [Hoeflea sp.]|uniref:bacteriochlorophyll 4-vinyl reductase n=1 Tax=Hoeflea sp. TaxID=1940281 RepID=UPI0019A68932|nr:bacteriochlorophyll 4-vinyl reductase [Hoeflea sp.]MBC7283525.1 bacteriochlorophyll 4-vinyl reductase [Hoeflea sp.]
MKGGLSPVFLNAARSSDTGAANDDAVPGLGGDHQVGPNAVIQIRAALIDAEGAGCARRVFMDAGLEDWFDTVPDRMVPAARVHRLNSELLASLDGETFEAVMREAGRRTGHYILENRIPGPAKRLLKLLPAGLAARALLKAIKANSWTFAGKAGVRVTPGHPAIIEIGANPLPMPGCPWHAAVFETLFATLLRRPVFVSHRIAADRTRLDRFELRWRSQTSVDSVEASRFMSPR